MIKLNKGWPILEEKYTMELKFLTKYAFKFIF